jgi:hypothetical protein
MERIVTVCPKCGYRHEATGNLPEKECPQCGIIYEKYFARQAALENAAAVTPDPPAPVPDPPARRLLPALLVAGAVLIILISGLAVWKYTGGKKGASASTSSSTEKVIKSFPYDIRGTYGSRFTFDYDGGSAGPAYAYTSDFEASLSIDDRYHVNQLSWTDNHAPLAKSKVSWESPSVAEVVCEERSGGTPEKNKEPFTQPLTLRRLGSALALDYHKPCAGGEVVFDWKNAVKEPVPGEGANGVFEYSKEQDALRAVVKVIVVPKMAMEAPRDAITTFTSTPRWAVDCIQPYLSKGGPKQEGGSYRGVTCERLGIFSAGSSGVNLDLKITNVDIPADAVLHTGSMQTMVSNPIQLSSESKFLFSFPGYEREAEVLFYRDGRKKLKIKDRKVAEKPLEYDLERK